MGMSLVGWGGMATIGEVHGGVDFWGFFWGGANVRGLREDRED